MAGPTEIDIELWSGDNWPPAVWKFLEGEEPGIEAGAQFILDITHGYGSKWNQRAYSSPDAGLTVDVGAATVTWAYTREDSRAMAYQFADYRLRCVSGAAVQVWAFGRLFVRA